MYGQEHESRGPRHIGGTTSLDVRATGGLCRCRVDWYRMGEVLPKKGALDEQGDVAAFAHLPDEMRNMLRVLQRALDVGINGGAQHESLKEGCHERCLL
ncbi:hypothetical protein BDZ89DRAFT_1076942 [Hymenopellis radicata]|nr:hypothetical protein BDZ89DRAFT_1076942 [Hymenopellis radicata]